jgi:hypothetical protein
MCSRRRVAPAWPRRCPERRFRRPAPGVDGSRPVSRILSAPPGFHRTRVAALGDHLSTVAVADDLMRPTWCSAGHLARAGSGEPPRIAPAWPCSGRGSPGRRRRRRRRCALTAPFHPYHAPGEAGPFGGLLSVARAARRRAWGLPSVLPCGVRTFLGTRLAARTAVAWPTPALQGTRRCAWRCRAAHSRRRATPERHAGSVGAPGPHGPVPTGPSPLISANYFARSGTKSQPQALYRADGAGSSGQR